MFRVKISVATYEFDQEIRSALHTAMKIGAQGVQFDLRQQLRPAEYGDTARRQILNYLSERNLQVASTHFSLRTSLFEKQRLDERLEAVRNAIVFASQLKSRVLTLRIGRLPAETAPEYKDLIIPVCNDLATQANHYGVTICLIPAGDPADALLNFLEHIKTGPIAIDADLGGWVLSGRSTSEQLRSLNEVIGQVEIRDAVRDVDGVGEEVPVGRGEIDWDEVAALLAEMDYSGWLNVRRSSGTDKVGDSMRAIQYLRNLIPSDF